MIAFKNERRRMKSLKSKIPTSLRKGKTVWLCLFQFYRFRKFRYRQAFWSHSNQTDLVFPIPKQNLMKRGGCHPHRESIRYELVLRNLYFGKFEERACFIT